MRYKKNRYFTNLKYQPLKLIIKTTKDDLILVFSQIICYILVILILPLLIPLVTFFYELYKLLVFLK